MHSLEVDYFLFMAVMMVLTSERVEKRLEVTPTVFPPPMFAGTSSISLFHVSPSLRLGIVECGILYRHF
jgi:hypothetical protein